MISQALSPRREILTLDMKMVRNAEQNLLGGALGFFFFLQVNGIWQNPNRFTQNWFSINRFFVVQFEPKEGLPERSGQGFTQSVLA